MRSNPISATGWGRVLSASEQVHRPERASMAARLAADTPAPVFGNRRSYGDGALNDAGNSIDARRLDRFLSFDPATGLLEAEAGVTLGDMLDHFAPRGWIPPVLPGTGFATLGGAIANDVHGKNHHEAGSFGQHVQSVTLLTRDGRKVVTPSRTPALFRATMGGLGQTGMILSAKLRLTAVPGAMMQVSEQRIENLEEFIDAFETSTAPYCVGWLDATRRGQALGRGIVEEGIPTSGGAPIAAKSRKVPFNAPSFALSKPVVRLFNRFYFQRVPPEGRSQTRPMRDFFFPLDRVHDWNRLYGKHGFHQFQCVLPTGQEDALHAILERIAQSGLASPLAVLKRLGPGRAGAVSFPMEGFTLAVDFAHSPKALALISELEDAALQANGRVYFAKDSTASAAMAAQMYPELPAFAKAANAADPDHMLETDLTRRLDLRSA